ncbi:MAG: hypothetical protein JO227_01410 [Acetobacteraceae bacterium]|nr:hypothetical protein [Acetobacteraceae bacterium]
MLAKVIAIRRIAFCLWLRRGISGVMGRVIALWAGWLAVVITLALVGTAGAMEPQIDPASAEAWAWKTTFAGVRR